MKKSLKLLLIIGVEDKISRTVKCRKKAQSFILQTLMSKELLRSVSKATANLLNKVR